MSGNLLSNCADADSELFSSHCG